MRLTIVKAFMLYIELIKNIMILGYGFVFVKLLEVLFLILNLEDFIYFTWNLMLFFKL
jgi:hypothetical protein